MAVLLDGLLCGPGTLQLCFQMPSLHGISKDPGSFSGTPPLPLQLPHSGQGTWRNSEEWLSSLPVPTLVEDHVRCYVSGPCQCVPFLSLGGGVGIFMVWSCSGPNSRPGQPGALWGLASMVDYGWKATLFEYSGWGSGTPCAGRPHWPGGQARLHCGHPCPPASQPGGKPCPVSTSEHAAVSAVPSHFPRRS